MIRSKEHPSPKPPARSDSFCIKPWTNLFVREDGAASVCCMAADKTRDSLRGMSLPEIWNSSEVKQLRLDMLQGRKNPLCLKCYEVEDAGGQSLRRKNNDLDRARASIAEQTRSDGWLDAAHLISLELNLSNACNCRCRYCCPRRSTGWYKDFSLLSGSPDLPAALTATDDFQNLYGQLRCLLPNLHRIQFGGGEPLIADWHHEILEILLAGGKDDVHLSYITNFSNLTHGGKDVLDLWKRFRHVVVNASLDAPGRQGEYIRKGLDWDQVLQNRERLMRLCPHVIFCISPTLSVLNALCLPDFHRDWLEKGYLRPNKFDLGILFGPVEYRCQILPPHLKREAVASYRRHIEFLSRRYGPSAHRDISSFQNAVTFIQAKDLSCLLGRFSRTTQGLDAIRQERFAEVFPELAGLVAGPDPTGTGAVLASYADLLSLETLEPYERARTHLELALLHKQAGRPDDTAGEIAKALRQDGLPADSHQDIRREADRILKGLTPQPPA